MELDHVQNVLLVSIQSTWLVNVLQPKLLKYSSNMVSLKNIVLSEYRDFTQLRYSSFSLAGTCLYDLVFVC